MPCVSDHMEATDSEVGLSRVACLLDELDGKPGIDKSRWNGYHPRVYNHGVDADALVNELCSKLQTLDVSKCSLEMQIWWRDHQKSDKERIEAEIKAKKTEEEKQAALAKLTPYERELLDV
jgi:hypothetical protein